MTMGRCSMDERLEYAAEYGKFFCYLSVWSKTIKEWRRNGLSVLEQYPTKNQGQFYCRISWEHSEPEEGKPMNQANRLWLIASEAVKRKIQQTS